jgi:excinuclease ABC subunit A
MAEWIRVRGARVHNLRNVDVDLPRDRLVVITGLSGSGKSSLAFDTIYAEGQRRYVESLSAYARQFLEQMEKPDVDLIDGLSPAISIEQKTTASNPRSTVGTVTEIYDYMRLLFANLGVPHCPTCDREIASQSLERIMDMVLLYPPDERINVLAPIVRGRKGEFKRELADGAIRPWAAGDRRFIADMLEGLQRTFGIDPALPFGRLPRKQRDLVLYGAPGRRAAAGKGKGKARGERDAFGADFEGVIPSLRRRFETGSWTEQEALEQYRALQPCPSCGGDRLRPESRAVRVKGRRLVEYVRLPLGAALQLFDGLELTERETLIAGRVLREIRDRLRFLVEVGVGYLTLARSAATLSGGEGQRIRLATQIGSQLTGVLYVLDEPSIGLHQRDNRRLLATLGKLRNLGNTVLVVEHDEETIRTADYLVDLGPGAGEHGGHVMFQGRPQQLLSAGDPSLTGEYLRGTRRVDVPAVRRATTRGEVVVRGARAHNLKGVDVAFPLGTLIAVTGVSGSGKSTLVNEILYRALAQRLYRALDEPGAHDGLDGIDLVDKVIQIDQSPIGRTPRSNPATYTGLFTFIRELFAMLPDARARGYKAGRFSFNVKGGRCETCQGDGVIAIEMHFLPNVYVTCEECKGRRYNRETLEIKYRGKSIAEMLDLTVDQALPLVENFPAIAWKLRTLQDVGLGYIKLGQSATTLSGGEAQRVKLGRELARRSTGRTLYILDEPTTGLHFEDVRRLLDVLGKLVDQGNTVVVIEHNLDVIKSADWVIDLGPEGGEAGGRIIAAGTPEDVAAHPASATGQFLRDALHPRQGSNLAAS